MAITLTGGELTLYDGWQEIARAVKGRRLALSLLTNATLFGRDGLDAIADLHPLSVSASLYGSEPRLHDAVTRVSGSFERTVAALSGLRSRGVRCRIGVVVLRENVGDAEAIVALAQELDCEFNFDPTVAPRADGNRDVLAYRASGTSLRALFASDAIRGAAASRSQRHPRPQATSAPAMSNCGAGITSAFVDAVATCTPAWAFPRSFGNVAATRFAGVWQGSTAGEHRRAMSAPLKACAACEFAAACGMRCPRLALVEDGDVAGVSSRACELAGILARWLRMFLPRTIVRGSPEGDTTTGVVLPMKKTYEKPSIETESVFEALAATCGYSDSQFADCNTRRFGTQYNS